MEELRGQEGKNQEKEAEVPTSPAGSGRSKSNATLQTGEASQTPPPPNSTHPQGGDAGPPPPRDPSRPSIILKATNLEESVPRMVEPRPKTKSSCRNRSIRRFSGDNLAVLEDTIRLVK